MQVGPSIPAEWLDYVLKETLASEGTVDAPDEEREVNTDLGDFAIRVVLDRQSSRPCEANIAG